MVKKPIKGTEKEANKEDVKKAAGKGKPLFGGKGAKPFGKKDKAK